VQPENLDPSQMDAIGDGGDETKWSLGEDRWFGRTSSDDAGEVVLFAC